MDLNNIVLNSELIVNLYRDTLVSDINMSNDVSSDIPNVSVKENKVSNSNWNAIGGNKRFILIIVNSATNEILEETDLTFLTGMLAACKLSLDDVTIVNIHDHPSDSYIEACTDFKSRITLLFDVSPIQFGLPMDFPVYQIQPFAGNSFLYAPSLELLAENKVEKSKIWVCLRRLFNI